MNRRGFLRSMLAGLAVAIAAPILARRAALSGRCDVYPVVVLGKKRLEPHPDCLAVRELLRDAPAYEGLEAHRLAYERAKRWFALEERAPARGSVIRFRRDPSKVFEL